MYMQHYKRRHKRKLKSSSEWGFHVCVKSILMTLLFIIISRFCDHSNIPVFLCVLECLKQMAYMPNPRSTSNMKNAFKPEIMYIFHDLLLPTMFQMRCVIVCDRIKGAISGGIRAIPPKHFEILQCSTQHTGRPSYFCRHSTKTKITCQFL